jgi:hypothetical protein
MWSDGAEEAQGAVAKAPDGPAAAPDGTALSEGTARTHPLEPHPLDPMGQTLLAVVAILVFSFFALNQHRARASADGAAMGSEVELAAADLARTRLVEAAALAFDEVVIGSTALQVDPNTLTLASAFGPAGDPGEDGTAPADDVDDLAGISETVTTLRDGRTGREMRFTVAHAVRYVRADAPGTGVPLSERTLAKEVSVTVAEDVTAGAERPPVRCTLSQVITPAWHAIHG